MKRSRFVLLGAAVLGVLVAFSPVSSQATTSLNIDQIIYQPSAGLDPSQLSATATATVSGNTLTIVLCNTSSFTGGDSATLLLTGIGFELQPGVTLTNTAAFITAGSSGYYKDDGNVDHVLAAGSNMRGEWGGGAAEGPFVDVATLGVDYVAGTLQSAFSDGSAFDPTAIYKNPVDVNGPEFGLLSTAFADAGGLGYVKSCLTLVWTFTGTLTEAGINSGNVVASFGSPTAVPEPHTLLLLGSGLVGIGMLRRKFRG